MSEIEVSISFPTDDENYSRRQCPLCRREFKVLLEPQEMKDLAKEGIEVFMLGEEEKGSETEKSETQEQEYYCPYCGQQSLRSEWWTNEQEAYIRVYAENIASQLINESLIKPMKRSFSGSSGPISIRFDGQELKMKEPWISPETNDMESFNLPCCGRKIKINEDWTKRVHCFFCGFPHNRAKPTRD